jgi:hypothetical protein
MAGNPYMIIPFLIDFLYKIDAIKFEAYEPFLNLTYGEEQLIDYYNRYSSDPYNDPYYLTVDLVQFLYNLDAIPWSKVQPFYELSSPQMVEDFIGRLTPPP